MDSTAPSLAYSAVAVENERLLNQFLRGRLQQQKSRLNAGALTVFSYTGATAARGLPTISTSYQPVAIGSGWDYLTDINVWARGSVASNGTITSNSVAMCVSYQGGPPIMLAPGEIITLRSKNPTQLTFKAAATPTTTDSILVWF
jgi:hypothetical protein